MNSLDARARYTRRVLEESFLFLLQEKPVGKITVTELCQRAQINRATFYKHYRDVPDLLECLVQQVLERLESFLASYPYRQFEQIILEVLNYMRREGERYFILGSGNADPTLSMKTFILCYKSAYPVLEEKFPQMSRKEMEMLYHYLAQGCGGVLTWWLRDGMKLEPEAVTGFISKLSVNTVKGFAEKMI